MKKKIILSTIGLIICLLSVLLINGIIHNKQDKKNTKVEKIDKVEFKDYEKNGLSITDAQLDMTKKINDSSVTFTAKVKNTSKEKITVGYIEVKVLGKKDEEKGNLLIFINRDIEPDEEIEVLSPYDNEKSGIEDINYNISYEKLDIEIVEDKPQENE